ncbi:Ribonuclease P/MRP protein subunit RPP1 [Pseudozyma hubeiensis]|nr:Ribonuclease P/MRP protein subunit RPP1 [Pseudozyma hubeiensis]
MFYDLNIPWPQAVGAGSSSSTGSASQAQSSKKKAKQQQQQQPPASSSTSDSPSTDPLSALRENDATLLAQIALELDHLRYAYVAFNHIVQSRYDPAHHPNTMAPRRDGRPNPPFPELDPRMRTNAKGKAKAVSVGDSSGLTQLSRLTLVLDEQSMAKSGSGWVTNNATALQSYDLLAVRPTTEAAFQHACLTLSELKPFSIDIISLDFGAQPRLPFFLKRSTVNAALENGVQFEITYAQVVSDDATKARRNLISGARDLLRVTNGKGVFFSSGATQALSLRAPYDVINLGAIFGLNPSAARDAISNNCRSLILRSQTRKTYRGVVSHPVPVLPTSSSDTNIDASLSPASPPQSNSGDVSAKKRKSPSNDDHLLSLVASKAAQTKTKKQRT